MFKLKSVRRYTTLPRQPHGMFCVRLIIPKSREKYPEHLYTNGRMRLLIGNFEGPEEAHAFIIMFKKFVADFEENIKRDNGRMIYVFEYDPKE